MADKQMNLNEALKRLQEINEWFDNQEDADVEE